MYIRQANHSETIEILREIRDKISTKLKVVATTIQITTGFFQRVQINWPKDIYIFSGLFGWINIDLFTLFPSECFFYSEGEGAKYRYRHLLVFNTIGPIVFSLLIFVR